MLGSIVEHGELVRAHQSEPTVLLHDLLLLLTRCQGLARVMLLLVVVEGLPLVIRVVVIEHVVLLPVACDGNVRWLLLVHQPVRARDAGLWVHTDRA